MRIATNLVAGQGLRGPVVTETEDLVTFTVVERCGPSGRWTPSAGAGQVVTVPKTSAYGCSTTVTGGLV